MKRFNTKRDEIERAMSEWQDAIGRFENATSDDMIELAIYDMEAAKRRFIFLLKKQPGGFDPAKILTY